jgi:Flp pilus assembly protein TadD
LQAIEMKSAPDVFGAGTLTGIAGRLIANDNLDHAIELLHVAGELFPEEAVIAETLGEIYLEMGRRYFMKALQLDPARENSWRLLKKIE